MHPYTEAQRASYGPCLSLHFSSSFFSVRVRLPCVIRLLLDDTLHTGMLPSTRQEVEKACRAGAVQNACLWQDRAWFLRDRRKSLRTADFSSLGALGSVSDTVDSEAHSRGRRGCIALVSWSQIGNAGDQDLSSPRWTEPAAGTPSEVKYWVPTSRGSCSMRAINPITP